jgi:hypothetical protein
MTKKILLVNPPLYVFLPFRKKRIIPYGLLKIGAFLKSTGYDVDLIDCDNGKILKTPVKTMNCGNYENEKITKNAYHRGKSFDEFKQELLSHTEPDEIWVTSSMTYYWETVHETIRICKEDFLNLQNSTTLRWNFSRMKGILR